MAEHQHRSLSPTAVVESESEEDDIEAGPCSQKAHPIVIQKMKSQQPMAPGGNPLGPVQMVEHTTNRPYMKAKLVNLVNQFHQ